jgi:hypothetical protein
MEMITFDVVDSYYPYSAIYCRGIINVLEVAIHAAYLCIKMPAQRASSQSFAIRLKPAT